MSWKSKLLASVVCACFLVVFFLSCCVSKYHYLLLQVESVVIFAKKTVTALAAFFFLWESKAGEPEIACDWSIKAWGVMVSYESLLHYEKSFIWWPALKETQYTVRCCQTWDPLLKTSLMCTKTSNRSISWNAFLYHF